MTTKQLVELVRLQAQWDRNGSRGILPLLSEAQEILLTNESDQTTAIDETTGDLPLLATVAGLYAYTLPSNIWRCGGICVATPLVNNYGLSWLSSYGYDNNLQYPIQDFYFAGRKYQRVQQIRTFDKTPSSAAKVVFTVDPGTSSSLFHYIGHKLPTPLLSETIQPSIPERFHMSHLLPATLKLIEGMQTGEIVACREYIEQKLKPDFWSQQSKGEQGYSGHTTRRGF